MVLKNHHNDDISLEGIKQDLHNYNLQTFFCDLSSGLSVALLTLPQAMAYAMLAGLPLSCGLFAAIYSSIIAALFGSSRQLVVGPSNTLAMLIQSGTAGILYTYYRELTGPEREIVAVQILTQLSFLTAVLQIFAAWCRLGRLTQFVSHSVIIGYIAGTALSVVISQVYIFLGIPKAVGVHSLYENAIYLLTHIYQTQWLTALVGFGSLFLLLSLKKVSTRIPAAVITFAIAGIAIEVLGLSSYSGSSLLTHFFDEDGISLPNVLVVGDNGEVYGAFPQLDFPFLHMRIMDGVIPVAFAVAILGIIDTTSVAKSIAAGTGQHLSTNQEIFGIGLGNLVSSFIGAMPVSGSPSRSGLNYRCGGLTRFSSIFNALFVALFIFVLGFVVTRIPLAAMSALVLVTVTSIVNTRQLLFCIKATPSDAFVLWTTLLSCLFFSLDIAFYVGVLLSITLYLKKAAMPHLAEYDVDDEGMLKNLDPNAQHEPRAIRIIKVEGELFFAAADLFQNTLQSIAEDDTHTKVIILQLKNARDIDATTGFALQQLNDYLRGAGRHLVACGITEPVWEVLTSSGLVKQIGEANLFIFDEDHPNMHMQKAIHRARQLAAEPIAVPVQPQVETVPAQM